MAGIVIEILERTTKECGEKQQNLMTIINENLFQNNNYMWKTNNRANLITIVNENVFQKNKRL